MAAGELCTQTPLGKQGIRICNSMARSEIWDKFHECCSIDNTVVDLTQSGYPASGEINHCNPPRASIQP